MDEAERYAEIAAVQARHDERLLALPNVVGTGIGWRQRGGRAVGELCLVVMVSQKLPPQRLPRGARLPRELDGAPIDVLETGAFVV